MTKDWVAQTPGADPSLEANANDSSAPDLHNESEQRLAGIVDSAMDAIITVDEEQRIVLFNPAAESMFGVSSTEALGQSIERFIPKRHRQAHAEHIRAFGRTGVSRRHMGALGTISGLRANGEEFPIEASISQIETQEGKRFTVILRDVTERTRAEAALWKHIALQDQLAKIAATVPGVICSFRLRPDGSTCMPYASSAIEELYGIKPEEVAEDFSPVFARTHPDDLQRIQSSIAESARTMTPWRAEFRYLHPQRGEMWFEGHSVPVREPDGGILWHGFVHDITERKQAEQALRDSQADLNRAQTVGQIGSWRLDVQRNELTWSDENHRIFGIPKGSVLTYQTFLSRVHPDDREYVERRWQAGLHGEPYDIEHRLLVDGQVKWVREKAELEVDERGTLLGGFGTTQDITEQVLARERMAELAESLRFQLRLTKAITDQAPDAIFVLDADGRVISANPEAERVLGFDADEFTGQVLHDLVHNRLPDGCAYPAEQCPIVEIHRSGRTVHEHEDVFFRKDGQAVAVSCANAPLDVEGNPAASVLIAHDITARKQAEEALREANRRKDEFLAMLAHELRNPLAPIRNAASVLGRLGLDEPRLKWAQAMIEQQVVHLGRLVDDLLDVSRIVRGKILLKKEECQLDSLVQQAVDIAQPQIKAKGQVLEILLPSQPVRLLGDRLRLTQVLLNLLDNASKYTPNAGRIVLEAEVTGREIVITVRDNGIGIAPELLPRVFDLFQQGERTLDRSQGGLGLGLTLVQQLVTLHGGRVEARSAGQDKGSAFTIWLPVLLDTPAREPDKREPVQRSAKVRVLVVDDDAAVAESMSLLLELIGHEVKTAATGEIALALARSFGPEVVLLDIGLPGMDGYEVARRLRRQQPDSRRLRLVAVTGYGDEETLKRARAAGFDQHLVKPVDPEIVFGLLSAVGANDESKG